MKFLDANIILRYITNDIPKASLKCEQILQKETLFTNMLVIAEVIWVLFSNYHFPKEKVIEAMYKILNSPNIHLENKELIISALNIFAANNIDFIDAYNVTTMKSKGLDTIYSYDKHFDQIPQIKRIEP